jgi:glycine/D-amino acid oxidase-like deaminating enzyme
MSLPANAKFVVIGAGIHGISTAYHLALELQTIGDGCGADIIVLDKSEICAGATGIACGVIRNNYFQPAMRELMAHSVAVWESDPESYNYHAVGYMQISCEAMHTDIASVSEQQRAIGYESSLIEGADDCNRYMRSYFDDWQAQGITSVLHEKRGGYANNRRAVEGVAAKAKALDVRIFEGVEVLGFQHDTSGAIERIETTAGTIDCEFVVVAAGPWVRDFWAMLQLPGEVEVTNPQDATQSTIVPMWTYWSLQEGTLGVDPDSQRTNDGGPPPVLHVDTDAPLFSDIDGKLITNNMWGVYYKPDLNFGGVQGGAAPHRVEKPAHVVDVDPYGPLSTEFVMGEDFAHMWVSALAHCQKRFSGTMPYYKHEPSGGIGAFTPDSFPVFDRFCDNCYVIADSNHGYKMLGVGKLVASEILSGRESALLQPFRFSRYAEGRLHPVSNSPFPWS